jgi:F-type H+-transporting ATPase subunit g
LFGLPGRYEAFSKELDGVKQVWKNRKDLKVEEHLLLFLLRTPFAM